MICDSKTRSWWVVHFWMTSDQSFTQDTKFEIYQICLGKLMHKSDDSDNYYLFMHVNLHGKDSPKMSTNLQIVKSLHKNIHMCHLQIFIWETYVFIKHLGGGFIDVGLLSENDHESALWHVRVMYWMRITFIHLLLNISYTASFNGWIPLWPLWFAKGGSLTPFFLHHHYD